MAMIVPIVVAVAIVLLVWIRKALKPTPSRICGSPGGPPVTSPRVKLSDGRHLAYREFGCPKEEARHKIIVCHGYGSSKDVTLPVSQELVEELKLYFLFFDRAGYGESDPYPSRSVKSEAYDVQELADKLQISKFYVMGISMGAYSVWSCLKYIPHRLLGASLVVPFVHYWWPCFPSNLSREALLRLPLPQQCAFRIAHYAPWLIYWWMTQKWFPSLSMMTENMELFNKSDLKIIERLSKVPNPGQEKIHQQGEYESLHRDMITAFGKWEFDPLDISNPFPNNEGSVHIWQGYEDWVIPFKLNRYLSEKIPWIHYHEVPDAGHMLIFDSNLCEAAVKALCQVA
ncbi:alpha/beta-Hydrolases superfamily protein [Quillaja saponaria]|uniref:Alpha/beta-Hydrolases superfamily protein n=1 Tax=Quillaja saponaria TaxID=32244 RepID=A0AAD7VMD1_QUISA|nr:alpha/beta-Hydrolases superfamily protein [Quillaja saponaria]